MDSANPHSSSGGDDDHTSRATVDQPVFPNAHSPLSDPFSSYTQQLHQQPHAWTGLASLRSEPNPPPAPSSQPPRAAPENSSNAGASTTPARSPRKRTRVSRRAPTTVLATDATNFRAKVQEFTGIPDPLFGNPSFPRPHGPDFLFGRWSNPPISFSQTPAINNQQRLLFPKLQTSDNNNQNPLFSFLNPPRFTFSVTAKTRNQAGSSLEESGLGGYGSDHHQVTTPNDFLNLIDFDQSPEEDRDNDRDDGNAANSVTNVIDGDGDHDRLKQPINGGLEFPGEKGSGSGLSLGSENIGGDQGTVESWINYSSA